jgi:hypothetical protein
MFLYGYTVTPNNRFITFGTSVSEVPPTTARTATLNLGYYSLTSLMAEVARALAAADPTHIYTVTANRTVGGGLENRVTIATNFTYLTLYFSSGNASNPASLLGFLPQDYSGSTSYTGSLSSGTVLIPEQLGYTFLPPELMQKNFGVVNISASGLKESVVYNIQTFWQVKFRYISRSNAMGPWQALILWMIQQRRLEFTPEITSPTVFYEGTLEGPNSGLELSLAEMLSDGLPQEYETPLLKFRQSNTT